MIEWTAEITMVEKQVHRLTPDTIPPGGMACAGTPVTAGHEMRRVSSPVLAAGI